MYTGRERWSREGNDRVRRPCGIYRRRRAMKSGKEGRRVPGLGSIRMEEGMCVFSREMREHGKGLEVNDDLQ